jgi:hypothetical protein
MTIETRVSSCRSSHTMRDAAIRIALLSLLFGVGQVTQSGCARGRHREICMTYDATLAFQSRDWVDGERDSFFGVHTADGVKVSYPLYKDQVHGVMNISNESNTQRTQIRFVNGIPVSYWMSR